MPAEYGLWASVGVILGYVRYADLGMGYHLGKGLPRLLTEDDGIAYTRKIGLGFTWSISVSVLITLGFTLAAICYKGADPEFYVYAFYALAAIGATQLIKSVGVHILNSREEYALLSKQAMAVEILGVGLSLILIVEFGPLGLVASLLITEIITTIYVFVILIKARYLKMVLNIEGLRSAISSGMWLLFIGLLEMLLMTTDQIFIMSG